MDSNGKFLKPDLFWKKEGTIYERTPTIQDIARIMDQSRTKTFGCILISCGVNDIEEKSGQDVARELLSLVGRIKQEHPSTKIVISEITPFFARDEEVRICNGILHRELSGKGVLVVKLDRLRDETWSLFRLDRKHIKESKVPIFTKLLIDALRIVHDTPNRRQNNTPPNREHQAAKPLMGKILPNPLQSIHPTKQPAPIGQRLQSIADGGVPEVDPKRTLISKLLEVVECVKGW